MTNANRSAAPSVDRAAKKLYILGHPVAHSKSPAMYNAVYERLGLPWTYGLMDLSTAEEARDFIAGRDYLSLNVTTPYKPQAYEAATVKAATAQLARGVNLLVAKEQHLIGYNVDGQGCVRFLEREGVDFRERSVAVCGTGPTALSILHAAVVAGAAQVLLLGRDKDRTRSVLERYVEDFRHLASTAISLPAPEDNHLGFAEAYEHADYKFGTYETSKKAIAAADIVIDATVLGMREGDPAPFDTALLHGGQAVMDTVYGHGETALVAAARAAGCRAFDGAGMLVSQGVLTATILAEIEDVPAMPGYDELFDIMAKAAGFDI